MADTEVEIRRAILKEDIRLARQAWDRFSSVEPLPGDQTPAAQPGRQLAYENLQSAEMALRDFEIEHPAVED